MSKKVDVFGKRAIFLWNVPAVCGGDPESIGRRLVAAGFDAVYIKASDGAYPYTLNWSATYPNWGENIRRELVDTLHSFGIKALGWGCPYGYDPQGEGKIAASQVKKLHLDGYIFDVETTSDSQATADSNGVHTMLEFRAGCDVPAAFCWWPLYRSPSSGAAWHPVKVAHAWLDYVDAVMPMMYWWQDSEASALWMLEKSMAEWRSLTDLPIIPAGRAYNGDGCAASPAAMYTFAETAITRYGCSGLTWWVMDQAERRSDLWEALLQINAGSYAAPAEPAPVTVRVRLTALADHINLRLQPGLNDSERGGLMAGDEVDVLEGIEVEADGYHYVPAIVYVAREYLHG